MKSYRKTYGLEALFIIPEIFLIISTLCPALFIILVFEKQNILIAFLTTLSLPILVFCIAFLIFGVMFGIINLITHLIQKPTIFLTDESIKYKEKERFFKHIEKVEFKQGYRSTPNELILIPKYEYHKEITIENPPLKIIKFLKNKFGQNFVNKDQKLNKIFTISCAIVGIILAIIALIYKLS